MKAVVIRKFGSHDVFELDDLPEPEITNKEVLIRVISGSINPIDYKQRKGNHKYIMGSDFPIVLGYDVAGTVIKTGDKVSNLKPGDRVCGVLYGNKYGGGLQEMAKGKENCFSVIPDGIDHIKSAALPMAGLTALQALRDKGNIKKKDKILIIGAAGGVGHLAVQIANIFEAEVYAVSSSRHHKFLNRLEPFSIIDYQKENILELKERFQIIFDVVGKYSFLKMKQLLVPGGIYINTLPRPKILAHKLLSIFTKKKKVKTLLMRPVPSDLELLLEWVHEKKMSIKIDREFALDDISLAHKYIEEGHTEGKILVRY
ncbi:MAG: NAD(P)-dependent alcohol dehydrogenase [Bacteroidales bacterium]|nr:NAD(P)-dependent alcohol dehydrogenase [Bacteroidales bacterium]